MSAIRFMLNGEAVAAEGIAPTTTLLEWLRERRRLTGTKEGCAEGDCGACTVGLKWVGPEGEPVLRAVNACILLMPTLHGREVTTVEGIAPHPAQDLFVEHHASQCGFCTPGFVISLWAGHEGSPRADCATTQETLAGNLCRCTGYGPILKAAEALQSSPSPLPSQAKEGERAGSIWICSANPNGRPDWGEGLDDPSEDFSYAHAGRRFFAPASTESLARIYAENPQARILAGGTDVGLWVTKKGYDPETMIYTGRAQDLARVEMRPEGLVIGAAATYEAAFPEIIALYPGLEDMFRRIGGAQVRSVGTIGGNIANGSPIGDTPPALIAAGARLRLRKGDGRREIALEDFFIAYGKQDRAQGEFVESVVLPVPDEIGRLKAYKLSKRRDEDISALCGAFDIAVKDGIITGARLAYGGMAGTPKRAKAAEAMLMGRAFNLASVKAAMKALEQDYAPLTDWRASKEYRMIAAQNLLLKYALEQGAVAPEEALS